MSNNNNNTMTANEFILQAIAECDLTDSPSGVESMAATVRPLDVAADFAKAEALAAIKDEVETFNNTIAYVHAGKVFIDSMKYAHVFNHIAAKFELPLTIIHKEIRQAVLLGEESTGLTANGKLIICNLYCIG
jgi:hypothetical protein